MGVLAAGMFFGLIGVKPIPAIILAQALNGVLLPFVAVFLFIIVNDRTVMGSGGVNGTPANICMGGVVVVTIVLGLSHLLRAVTSAFGLPQPGGTALLAISALCALALCIPLIRMLRSRR